MKRLGDGPLGPPTVAHNATWETLRPCALGGHGGFLRKAEALY